MKVLIAKPDVFVPLGALVGAVVGSLSLAGATVALAFGRASMCQLLPVYAAGCGLSAWAPWELHRTRFDGGRRARRLALGLLILSLLASAGAISAWLGTPRC